MKDTYNMTSLKQMTPFSLALFQLRSIVSEAGFSVSRSDYPLYNVQVLIVNISIKIELFAFYRVIVCNGAVQNDGEVLRTPPILNSPIAYHKPIKCKKSNFNP